MELICLARMDIHGVIMIYKKIANKMDFNLQKMTL